MTGTEVVTLALSGLAGIAILAGTLFMGCMLALMMALAFDVCLLPLTIMAALFVREEKERAAVLFPCTTVVRSCVPKWTWL